LSATTIDAFGRSPAIATTGRMRFRMGRRLLTGCVKSFFQKKRQLLFPKSDLKLDGSINDSQTTITLDSVENLFLVPDHPAYSPKDESLLTYVRIDDEIIEFSGITGLQLTGCIRGSLGTTAAAHDDEAEVNSFYKLEGNAMDLALKLMLSDSEQTDYLENLTATSVGIVDLDVTSNSIYFAGIDLTRDYNVKLGDYVKTQNFTEGANNIATYTEILDVVQVPSGSYIVLDAALIYEVPATGDVSFLSKYNTLGIGLGMSTDEVDISRHEDLRRNFISNFDYRFFVREEIEEGKAFIEQEIYLPASCYALPIDRNGLARVSVGIHKPPVPGSGIITVSRDNIISPNNLEGNRAILNPL